MRVVCWLMSLCMDSAASKPRASSLEDAVVLCVPPLEFRDSAQGYNKYYQSSRKELRENRTTGCWSTWSGSTYPNSVCSSVKEARVRWWAVDVTRWCTPALQRPLSEQWKLNRAERYSTVRQRWWFSSHQELYLPCSAYPPSLNRMTRRVAWCYDSTQVMYTSTQWLLTWHSQSTKFRFRIYQHHIEYRHDLIFMIQ